MLANLDIHGFVTVRAKNVTISNCIVRGAQVPTARATGLITDYGYDGLLITDTYVVPSSPRSSSTASRAADFTARRVHVVGGVDSIKIQGSNVTVEDSLLENTDYYASDPQQSGGPTHNDNIQILYGTNLKITGNTIRGATNFAVLGGATRGDTNLAIQNNWLDGGHCTVKLQILNGYSETAKVTSNKFGPNRARLLLRLHGLPGRFPDAERQHLRAHRRHRDALAARLLSPQPEWDPPVSGGSHSGVMA